MAEYGSLSTHVLDTSVGTPACGVLITLYRVLESKLDEDSGSFSEQSEFIATGKTNSDGRLSNFVPKSKFISGLYKLVFGTGTYFESRGIQTFLPYVQITFQVSDQNSKYHVPIILSPFGYSTYRGS
mmetsp:Transcript_9358/g.16872  ORF Transcript_9358/g.16872 Transcript_9358/m.16872 type:complete len:127 (-) Transcript_9358:70-450(-)